MDVQLHSTEKIVTLVTKTGNIQARIWEGITKNGVMCHAYITRIAVAEGEDAGEFDRDLQEHQKPSPSIEAIPLRMII